jgi:hypothetical protein
VSFISVHYPEVDLIGLREQFSSAAHSEDVFVTDKGERMSTARVSARSSRMCESEILLAVG